MTYIWEKEIEKIDWVTVYFKDGTSKEYTEASLSYLVTEEVKNPTELQDLLMDNILPEIRECIVGTDTAEITGKILLVFEKHDVSNFDIQKVMTILPNELIEKHNEFLKEKVGKEIDAFKASMELYQSVIKTVWDSYENGLLIAIWRAFWTYENNKHSSLFLDNIRVSDLRKYLS